MCEQDRQDAIGIVARLCRIAARPQPNSEASAARAQLASEISTVLCGQLGLRPEEVAAAAFQQACAMGRDA